MASPEKNENGVYTPTEHLSLARNKAGWRGCNLADIKLADLGTHWIWATSYQMMTGNCSGSSSPLMDMEGPYKSWRALDREAAIKAASADLRKSLTDRATHCADARAVLAWLGTLIPDQLDMFA